MIQTSLVDRTDSLERDVRSRFNGKLAGYLAASGVMATAISSQADAAVVANTSVQPFGINGAVGIDFNADGQIDFEIDHDRVDLGGGSILDYLQVDKNDTNGASLGENLLPINVFDTFDTNGGFPNDTADAAYVINGAQGDYPAALSAGTLIGPSSSFDFQEADNFQGTGKTIRANRLIDEDATQIDQVIGGLTPAQVQVPTNGPNFLGLGGDVGYLGVRFEPQSAGGVLYGWVGIRIDNEADATGAVVGYAYETTGAPIRAGQVPEPTSILTVALGVAALFGKRMFGRSGRRVEK